MKAFLAIVLGLGTLTAVGHASERTVAEAAAGRKVTAAIQSLNAGSAESRQLAKLNLLEPEAAGQLKAHQAELIAALRQDWEADENALILARLDLPEDLRTQLLESPRVPRTVRARLGDVAAARQLARDFAAATTLAARHKLAADLVYVESPESWRAFAAGVSSVDLVHDPQGNQVSVALLAIQAYGNAHPEEPLFSASEYMKHADVSPAEFQQPAHQAYLRQLEQRLMEVQRLQVRIDPPFLLNTGKVEKHFDKGR
jgi:hypothetical protein